MKILADENIPLVHSFFGSIGDIQQFSGRELTAREVQDADILLVRSVTRVDETLIGDAPLKFVGSTTIGLDHVDTEFLDARRIPYANAPACNSDSVVEYVISALSFLSEFDDFKLEDKSIGIVGYGNVGSRLAKVLAKLGMSVMANDPILADAGEKDLCSLEEVMQCDIISLHVPLTHDGPYPTYHLFDEARIAALRDNQVLINTCRGGVIDNQALRRKLETQNAQKSRFRVVLDVWEHEPNVDRALLELVSIATPHIAGYSYDGKARGTDMIYQALCRTLGLPVRHKAAQFLSEPPLSKLAFTSQADPRWALNTAIQACYDVRMDSWRMKALLQRETLGPGFDALRRNYPVRREFFNVKVQLKNVDSDLFNKFRALGFKTKN
ncbi:MAG: 4-phosphoerythronate dehydrogenase PdxB [Pseudomonadales bacterium]|nr:4-phosphoerythronate dehydrogenase PdxB [Pseudomonadales bacterium]